MRKLTTRSERLRLRLTAEAKHILQSAAVATHRSLSEFILDSALTRAEETLPNRQRFGLAAERWEAFQRALDAPPRPLARIARLLNEPSVFDRGNK
jgi:uncharacterized protein (DUF1778 family)